MVELGVDDAGGDYVYALCIDDEAWSNLVDSGE